LLAALCVGPTAHASDWPQFRGPNGSGVSDETGLPDRWDIKDGTNIRWKVELAGHGVSGPVVAKGKIYVLGNTGYRRDRLHVICLDANTGKKLWERQFTATGSTNSHPLTNMAAATPVTDGDHVYALFSTGDVACLDSDGNLVWYRSLVGDYPTITNQVGMAASPVLVKDKLIVPMDNAGNSFLAALDVKSGQNLWKAERPRDINWVTPVVLPRADRTEILFQGLKTLTAYDARTGMTCWEHKVDGLSIPSPTLAEGLVLVPGKDLIALQPANEISKAQVVWSNNKLSPTGYPTPLYYDKRVYAISGGSFLNSAEIGDGTKMGEPLRFNAKGGFAASPLGADGKIYLFTQEGTGFVVKPGEKPELISTNPFGETILGTPAIANGAIYVRTDGYLYCIGRKK
jgi:outer membrane protein assembly factor BamB